MARFSGAIAQVISVVLSYWVVLTAATPNVLSWVAPQDGFLVGVWVTTDVKTAITVLSIMVEKGGTNILSAVVDMNAAAVRVPTAGVLGGSLLDVNGFIPVAAGDIITVDVDTLTGTSFNGLQVQLDFLPK